MNQFHPTYHVLTGKIIRRIPNGVLFKITEVLRGVETRDTITIWDDKPFECNGPFLRLAHTLGVMGDMLVVALPQIDSLENAWEKLKDYRTPEVYAYTSSLSLRDNILEGKIAGVVGRTPRTIVLFDYELFKTIMIRQRSCPGSVSTHDFPLESSLKISPNPFNDQIALELDATDYKFLQYQLMNLNGQILQQGELFNKQLLTTSTLPNGMYLLVIQNKEGVILARRKVVKVRL